MGLALSYVAQTLQIVEDQLKDYEEGKKQIPFEVLSKLSGFYRVSPAYFLGGGDPPSQKLPSSSNSKNHILF